MEKVAFHSFIYPWLLLFNFYKINFCCFWDRILTMQFRLSLNLLSCFSLLNVRIICVCYHIWCGYLLFVGFSKVYAFIITQLSPTALFIFSFAMIKIVGFFFFFSCFLTVWLVVIVAILCPLHLYFSKPLA